MGIIPRISAGSKVIWLELSTVNASSAHIESESSAHIANESSAHRETASSAHKERSSAHIDAGNQPFRVWLGGWGGDKSVIDAGNKGGIHGLKSSLDSAIWGLVGGGGGVIKASLMLGTRVGSMDLNHHLTQPFRVWLGGVGGDKSVIDAGNKGGIHGLKSSLDSAIWGLVGGGLCEKWEELWDELCDLWDERKYVRWVVWVVRWVELCEMSCVSCEMSCVKELGWTSVRAHESSSTKCHTKAALEWVELCEMSCERWVVWDELCDLWDERSCVRWVVWVVRWAELCDMSCVSCEMSCVKELGWSSVRGHESSSTKCHTKAALEWVELCEMSWVRWVVWVELWEMTCVRWVVWVVRWEELCEMKCARCVRQLGWSWERKKQLRRRRRRRQGIQA